MHYQRHVLIVSNHPSRLKSGLKSVWSLRYLDLLPFSSAEFNTNTYFVQEHGFCYANSIKKYFLQIHMLIERLGHDNLEQGFSNLGTRAPTTAFSVVREKLQFSSAVTIFSGSDLNA